MKQLKNKLSKAERAISDTEKEILDMDAKLADDYEKTAADPKFFENYQAKKDSLDDLMEAWAELDEKVNSFSA